MQTASPRAWSTSMSELPQFLHTLELMVTHGEPQSLMGKKQNTKTLKPQLLYQNFKGRTFSCNLSISTVSHQYSPFSKVSEYSFSSSTVWYQYFYFVRTFNAL